MLASVELRRQLSASKELAAKVHALELKVSAHEGSFAELAYSMAELLATQALPPKRPTGFINPEGKGKKEPRLGARGGRQAKKPEAEVET